MLDKLVVFVLSLKAKLSSERGQDLLEYAILSGTLALVVLAGVGLFAGSMDKWFTDFGTWIETNLLP
jgi:Flp pilus assembly pilin Flp